MGFEHNIVYQLGKENKVVDALSRKEGSPILWTVFSNEEPRLCAVSGTKWRVWDKLREAVKVDRRAQEILEKLENKKEGVLEYNV